MDNIELDLKQMFDRRASDVEVSGHLSASLRSRARLQRFATISSTLLLVVLSVAGGLLAFRQIATDFKVPGDGTINPSGRSSTYTDPKLGWSWKYPANWHLQTFSGGIGLGLLEGALVTNVDRDFHHPDLGSCCSDSGWDMSDTPDDLVVVEFHCLDAGAQSRPSRKPDTAFPLALGTFKQATDQPSYGAPQPRLWKAVRIHGDQHFGTSVWLGHKVSQSEKATASRIVSSITKPTGRCP
jgi:hypothetical protein